MEEEEDEKEEEEEEDKEEEEEEEIYLQGLSTTIEGWARSEKS